MQNKNNNMPKINLYLLDAPFHLDQEPFLSDQY